MALRLGMLKCAAEGKNGCRLGIRKWTHVVAMAPPLDGAIESSIASPQFTLPEFDANQDTSNNSSDFGFTFPGFSFGGSMELMAVPKRKNLDPSDFSGLNLQSTNLSSKGDIEDQVIDVNALPLDGCRKFYTAQFLRESEEGGELEVESPGFDDSCAKKSCDTGVVTTNPLKSCSPSRDTFRYENIKRLEDMDVGCGVEMSNDFQPEKSTYEQSGRVHMESTIEMDRRNDYDQEESTHCPEVNEINATNYGNAHQEKDILIHYKVYP
ncbi:hypothetical protein POTOM_038372 [Populus tomentosa]|uniref:Uncharacterized protein n=1 Tax=Populus tomentosa TaxID=118781 RepID=A0A8X7YVG7_POPTO|nr:hypothetical protein POTOM_038372 [Populus tomentosa]